MRDILERNGDSALPAPSFGDLETSAVTGNRRASALALMVGAACLALVAAVGALSLRDDTGSAISVASGGGTSASQQSGFVPARTVDGDSALFVIELLDGSRVALWLPLESGFEPDSYSQSAELRSVDGSLPPVRVDNTNCDRCSAIASTAQIGPWELTATGDAVTPIVWADYLALLDLGIDSSGYLAIQGDVSVGPIDGPSATLASDRQRLELIVMPCKEADVIFRTTEGFGVVDHPDDLFYRLCHESGVTLVASSSLFTSRTDLSLVRIEILARGSLLEDVGS